MIEGIHAKVIDDSTWSIRSCDCGDQKDEAIECNLKGFGVVIRYQQRFG